MFLEAVLRHMSVLLSLRLLPFAAHAAVSRRATLPARATAVALYAVCPALACLTGAKVSIAFVLVGCVYYLLASLGLRRLVGLLRARAMTHGGAFAVIAFVCLFLPGVALPGIAMPLFLVVGWELALSAYSYCVETSRPGRAQAPLGDCLFFLLVNPTVLYTASGSRLTSPSGSRWILRAAGGLGLLLLETALLTPLATQLKGAGFSGRLHAASALALPLSGAVRLLAVYAAHSGLASLQIALMRRAGWQVPERYEYPLFSSSPMDFWRRWNTYVRVWLEGYVFFPLARRLTRTIGIRAAGPVAAAATLLASGFLHDGYQFAGRQVLSGATTELFLAAGALLILWRLGRVMDHRIRAKLEEAQMARFERATRMSGRLCVCGALVCAAIVWG